MLHSQRVRAEIYDAALRSGEIPTVDQLSRATRLDVPSVRAAVRSLAAEHVLVLQPEGDEVLMAMPFSAVPTPFAVRFGDITTFANCSWDALGIAAMHGADTSIRAACGCCGTAIELEVTAGTPTPMTDVLHFAVPVARWWDDVVFT